MVTTLDRLATKFTVGDECWLWTASPSPNGYGQFWLDGRPHRAHRVVYELLVGPIPDGLELDHLCRVRRCVRPSHLEPVTHRENLHRGAGTPSRTHCPARHAYDETNTYRYPDGRRDCRRCRADRRRRCEARA